MQARNATSIWILEGVEGIVNSMTTMMSASTISILKMDELARPRFIDLGNYGRHRHRDTPDAAKARVLAS